MQTVQLTVALLRGVTSSVYIQWCSIQQKDALSRAKLFHPVIILLQVTLAYTLRHFLQR
jgi:hypothetical protein